MAVTLTDGWRPTAFPPELADGQALHRGWLDHVREWLEYLDNQPAFVRKPSTATIRDTATGADVEHVCRWSTDTADGWSAVTWPAEGFWPDGDEGTRVTVGERGFYLFVVTLYVLENLNIGNSGEGVRAYFRVNGENVTIGGNGTGAAGIAPTNTGQGIDLVAGFNLEPGDTVEVIAFGGGDYPNTVPERDGDFQVVADWTVVRHSDHADDGDMTSQPSALDTASASTVLDDTDDVNRLVAWIEHRARWGKALYRARTDVTDGTLTAVSHDKERYDTFGAVTSGEWAPDTDGLVYVSHTHRLPPSNTSGVVDAGREARLQSGGASNLGHFHTYGRAGAAGDGRGPYWMAVHALLATAASATSTRDDRDLLGRTRWDDDGSDTLNALSELQYVHLGALPSGTVSHQTLPTISTAGTAFTAAEWNRYRDRAAMMATPLAWMLRHKEQIPSSMADDNDSWNPGVGSSQPLEWSGATGSEQSDEMIDTDGLIPSGGLTGGPTLDDTTWHQGILLLTWGVFGINDTLFLSPYLEGSIYLYRDPPTTGTHGQRVGGTQPGGASRTARTAAWAVVTDPGVSHKWELECVATGSGSNVVSARHSGILLSRYGVGS